MPSILIIDDEQDICELVSAVLKDEGHQTFSARNSDDALKTMQLYRPEVVLLDIWLENSELDGLSFLKQIQNDFPSTVVIMISGHANVQTAVNSIKEGAYDFIEKPFKSEQLVIVVERALKHARLSNEINNLKKKIATRQLIGKSQAIQHLKHAIKKVASNNSRILITGDYGVGKELVAREIHKFSCRSNNRFVTLRAANITPELMESELFGIEKDGIILKIGALERAHRGTLFLDEIADMPLDTQNKILLVLTEQSFERVGGTEKVHVDVRILSSTSQNLRLLCETNKFRADLYYRISVIPIEVPPLKKRTEDIELLVNYFIKKISKDIGVAPCKFDGDVMDILKIQDWPGNVRQLKNYVERIMIMANQFSEDRCVTLENLPDDLKLSRGKAMIVSDVEILSLPLRAARKIFEKEYLQSQLDRFSGNISQTAEFIEMERSALHRKMKHLDL